MQPSISSHLRWRPRPPGPPSLVFTLAHPQDNIALGPFTQSEIWDVYGMCDNIGGHLHCVLCCLHSFVEQEEESRRAEKSYSMLFSFSIELLLPLESNQEKYLAAWVYTYVETMIKLDYFSNLTVRLFFDKEWEVLLIDFQGGDKMKFPSEEFFPALSRYCRPFRACISWNRRAYNSHSTSRMKRFWMIYVGSFELSSNVAATQQKWYT